MGTTVANLSQLEANDLAALVFLRDRERQRTAGLLYECYGCGNEATSPVECEKCYSHPPMRPMTPYCPEIDSHSRVNR